MTIDWKKYGPVLAVWTILITAFSFSGAFGLKFVEIFFILISFPIGAFTYLLVKDPVVTQMEVELTKAVSDYETIVEDLVKEVAEHMEVIKEYEQIFDQQLVELPCICGGNTFKGLFSSNAENIVHCEKCGGEYRVTVNYDSVLLAEPMDQKSVY